MNLIVLFAIASLQLPPVDAFSVQCELQGLYDEASQMALAARSAAEIDMFHVVLDTPDFVVIDTKGARHPWEEMRARAVQALKEPPFDSLVQMIQKLSLTSQGVVVVTNVTSARKLIDEQGQYGPKGTAHTLSKTTVVRDTWVRAENGWRRKMREEISEKALSVDGKSFKSRLN